jgi:7-cyano-7-deazaguanine synthase
MKPAVVLLSGGLDSATTLAIARSQGYETYALSFAYGQRHSRELDSASHVAAVVPLLNDLIRPRQHRLRDRETERLGGLEVDDQLELRRLLDGQVAGLGTLENLDVISTLASCPA